MNEQQINKIADNAAMIVVAGAKLISWSVRLIVSVAVLGLAMFIIYSARTRMAEMDEQMHPRYPVENFVPVHDAQPIKHTTYRNGLPPVSPE